VFVWICALALGGDVVASQGLDTVSVEALPQPLSPFKWMVIETEGKRHHAAPVNLAADKAHPHRSGPCANGNTVARAFAVSWRPLRFAAAPATSQTGVVLCRL
jgi:hypothetical protein